MMITCEHHSKVCMTLQVNFEIRLSISQKHLTLPSQGKLWWDTSLCTTVLLREREEAEREADAEYFNNKSREEGKGEKHRKERINKGDGRKRPVQRRSCADREGKEKIAQPQPHQTIAVAPRVGMSAAEESKLEQTALVARYSCD